MGSTWQVPVLQWLVQGTCGQRPDRDVDGDHLCGGSGVAATAGTRPIHARDGLCVSARCWPDGAARCPRGLRGCAPHGRGPPRSRACSRGAELVWVGAANGAVLGPPRQPSGWPHLSWPTVCPGQPRPDNGDQLWRGGCRACGGALGAGCRSGARRGNARRPVHSLLDSPVGRADIRDGGCRERLRRLAAGAHDVESPMASNGGRRSPGDGRVSCRPGWPRGRHRSHFLPLAALGARVADRMSGPRGRGSCSAPCLHDASRGCSGA